MPQGPIPVQPVLPVTTTGPLAGATQVTVGPSLLKSATNLVASLATVATTSLTTSQIGAFYDAQISTATLSALSTTQVASLTTTQITALMLPNAIEQNFGGGNGIPLKKGLVWVPGTSQVVNVLKED